MTNRPGSPRKIFLGLGMAAIALLAGLAWLGLLTPEPAAVSLADTVQVAEQSAATGQTASSLEVELDEPDPAIEVGLEEQPAIIAAEPTSTVEADKIAGTWTVVQQEGTFAGYRADSQVGEAVGRTPGVTGSLEATSDQISAVNITVDMTQLTSDSSLRDSHLGDEGIEHNTYPVSNFVLTEPIPIDDVSPGEASITFNAIGDLTVREITLPVVVALEGALVGDQLVVVGSADINLDDYGASVSSTNVAVMEFSLIFER